MRALSSNAFSVDDQIADVISFLSLNEWSLTGISMDQFTTEFPEYNSLEWSGSWVDWEASNVDPDYMNWVSEWIERNTDVVWIDSEPFLLEIDDDYSESEIW